MADILDYLDWRGDIPFSADPFNEVDALVLSEVAYVDFEGIVPGPETVSSKTGQPVRIAIADAVKRYWELHTVEEIEKSTVLYRKAPYALDKLCSGARFDNMYLAGYVNQVSSQKNKQMSAITYYLSDGTAFAAFRGTDDTLIGWKEDFSFSFRKETEGQKSAAEYLNKMFGKREASMTNPMDASMKKSVKNFVEAFGAGGRQAADNSDLIEHADMPEMNNDTEEDFDIRVGGHSKGGNFAVYAAAFCEPDVKKRITEIFSNDGPGLLEEIADAIECRSIIPRVHSVIPEESLFGILLHSGYYHKIIKSNAKGIWQHDALSWQVKRNRFEEAEGLAEGSLMLKDVIESWVYGMNLKERQETVDVIFTLLEDTGFKNASDLSSEQLKSVPALIRAYTELSPEDKHAFHDTVRGLFKSGAESISEELRERLLKRGEKDAE